MWRYTRPDLFDFSRLDKTSSALWEITPLDAGVSQSPYVKSADRLPEAIAKELMDERHCGFGTDAVPYLQLAAAGGSAFFSISRNSVCKEPLLIRPVGRESEAVAPLLVVVVEEGASVTVVEDLSEGENSFIFPRIEVFLRDNSSLRFLSLNRLPLSAAYLGRHRFHVGRDVTADIVHVMTGCRVGRLDLDCRMYGPGSSCRLSSVYLGDGRRHVDLHTVQDHFAPQCRSDLLSKGVLRESSRSVFYGYIRVAEDAQKTDAYQTNRNLVLSDSARADSVPNLEIKADDVKCSHGATVGQVSEDELFYLMTRGIRRPDAEQLLVAGFLDEVISRIDDESLQTLVHNAVMERIENGSARG